MSWCSSIKVGGPLRRVFGLAAFPGLGELLLLSEVDLSLLEPPGAMFGFWGWIWEVGVGESGSTRPCFVGLALCAPLFRA